MSWPEGVEPKARKAGDPVPVSDLDARVVKDLHRTRWWLLVVVATILVAAVAVLAIVVVHLISANNQQRHEIQASCRFFRDLAPLPVSDAPGSRYPSKVSVTLVHDARLSFTGEQCAGSLPPPSPTYLRGARHFGLSTGG